MFHDSDDYVPMSTSTMDEHEAKRALASQSATDPQCLVGYMLQLHLLDGSLAAGVCTALRAKSRMTTLHVVQLENGEEIEANLRRKASHRDAAIQVEFAVMGRPKPAPFLYGYLVKQAMISKRNWKRRFFVLNGMDGKLRWWPSEKAYAKKGTAPSGLFDLTPRSRTVLEAGAVPAGVIPCDKSTRHNCLVLRSAATLLELTLQAPYDEDTLRSWRLALSCTLRRQSHARYEAELALPAGQELRDDVGEGADEAKEADGGAAAAAAGTTARCSHCSVKFLTFSGAALCPPCRNPVLQAPGSPGMSQMILSPARMSKGRSLGSDADGSRAGGGKAAPVQRSASYRDKKLMRKMASAQRKGEKRMEKAQRKAAHAQAKRLLEYMMMPVSKWYSAKYEKSGDVRLAWHSGGVVAIPNPGAAVFRVHLINGDDFTVEGEDDLKEMISDWEKQSGKPAKPSHQHSQSNQMGTGFSFGMF